MPSHSQDLFFEEMPFAVLVLRGGDVVRFNKAAGRLLESRRIGHPLSALLPEKEAGLIVEKLQAGGQLVLYDVRVGEAQFDLQCCPMDGEDWLIFYPRQRDDAVTGSLAVSTMSALGREIRAPLTLMLSALSLLAGGMNGRGEKQDYYLSALLQSCFRLLRLSNNLIDLPHYIQDKAKLCLQEKNINAFIREVVEAVRPFAEAKGVRLKLEAGEDKLILALDEQKVERLALNLLSNALENAEDGGEITFTVTSDSVYVYLTVADNGRGIPPEQLIQVFRVHASHNIGARSFGLGLPMVRALAEMHGGSVMLESRLGQGTTVTASLRRDKKAPELLRSRAMEYDYAGGFSHLHVELSEALPNGHEFYHPDALKG